MQPLPDPDVRHTGCPLCEAACGLVVRVEEGRVVDVRGDADDPLSRGHVCPKGVALQDLQDDDRWLRHPVRRTADGWEELGWDEAIDLVSGRLAAVAEQHGREAVATYLGNPVVHNFGAMITVPTLLATLGSRNRYSAGSVDQLPHQLASWALFGHQYLIPVPDIDRADRLILLGHNPMVSNGSIWTVPGFPRRLRALHERGGELIVIDPRRTETARVADQHHFIRPGTDAYLLLALVRTVLEQGLAKPADYVTGLDELTGLVAPFTPELAAERCGITPDVIESLAVAAAAPRTALHGRTGLSTQQYGLVCQWAIQVLHAITGNLDREGGVRFTHPAVDLTKPWLIPPGSHGRWSSRVRGLPETAGELPVATLADEMLTPGDGQVRALLTVAGNPVVTTPGGARLADAIEGLDFYVAIDPYLNATTRLADVVLPPTRPLERDNYDLIFQSLAVRNTARFNPAVLQPPEGTRHDWEILRDIIRGLHRSRGTRLPLMTRLQFSRPPRGTLDLLLRMGGSRLSLKKLLAQPSGVDLGPLRPSLPRRLRTRGKRLHLVPDLVRDDIARLLAPPTRADGELLLVGRRHLRDNNSWFGGLPRLNRGRPRHHLWIHPDDAAAHALTDGASAHLTSASGRLTTMCTVTTDVMPGVISLPHGYGWDRPGASVNDITDPDVTDSSGTAVLNGVPVTVTAADTPTPPEPAREGRRHEPPRLSSRPG